MEYRYLGKTGIQVSRYCLGTMMFGAMGNPDHRACAGMIHRALDAGVSFIDTADVYSAGESEEIVGKAVAGRRDDVVIATKFSLPVGRSLNMSGGSRRWIAREVDNSLRRLKTDYIDLYLMHRFDENTALEETISALSDLVHQGKIRAFGSSMFSADRIVESHWLSEARGLMKFRCEQPWYSLFAREIENLILPVCQRYGMGTMVFSPLDDGWLTGRYKSGDDFGKGGRVVRMASHQGQFDPCGDLIQRKLKLVSALWDCAAESGLSLTHVAMAFTLEHPGITAAIIGPRTPDQLEDLLECADLRLSSDLLDRIDAIVPPGTNVNPAHVTTRSAGLNKAALRRADNA